MIHFTFAIGDPDRVAEARTALSTATERFRLFDGEFFEVVVAERALVRRRY